MDRLGELLRKLRKKRGLSQKELAERALVGERTLRYWEADQQQPRDVELENVFKALKVTSEERAQVYALLTDPRSVRLVHNIQSASQVPTSVLGPLPGIGDLLRAMRVRRGWTQERFAEAMQVNRATVIRWEATKTLPSEEDMQRICLLLHALPQEQEALKARRLSLASWSPQLTLEECLQQTAMLRRVRNGDPTLLPLVDLHTLALKRQLRFLLGQSPEALRLLAQIEIQHSWWLYMQERKPEAWTGNWRALSLVRGTLAPETFWVGALNLLSAHAARGARGPENAVRLLYPWLRLLPASAHPFLLCDMALYASQAQRSEEAAHFLRGAQQVLLCLPRESTDKNGYIQWYLHMTTARVLLNGGKPVEALDRFPVPDLVGDGRIQELLVWAEAYLAAGEKSMAARTLTEVRSLLASMPLPQRQSKLQQLAQQL
ncbi:MAG TPA: helix-turn-helix transcriptional regulator [Chthonomonadaceae bacterium]|nr:helix-turn-helix transcriptional regulator [Chthonomonadaceae bacterium]